MKNVIICGLGAVGMTYGVKLKGKCIGLDEELQVSRGSQDSECCLKILVDEARFERYRKDKPTLNGVVQEFEYILPNDKFDADLVIIATKSNGLKSAIENLKNFVSEKTTIISLLNGISSEEEIKKAYPMSNVLKSYFIGHSAVREGNSVTQNGVGEIVVEYDKILIEFFEKTGINYSIPEDIDYSFWLKFTMNIFCNQTSAILNLTFGEMKNSELFKDFAKKIIAEVRLIAEKKGIQNLENLEADAFKALDRMCDEGKTSMLQDILGKRKTEVDIFAGEIIRLGKEFKILTPYNQMLYDLIKIKEATY